MDASGMHTEAGRVAGIVTSMKWSYDCFTRTADWYYDNVSAKSLEKRLHDPGPAVALTQH